MEEWRPIPGFDGYEISDHGNVRSWRVQGSRRAGDRRTIPKALRLSPKEGGYLAAYLTDRSGVRNAPVHRLVLEAFVGPCPEGMETRHMDGDPANNRLENLRWGTRQENADDRERHGTVPFGERSGQAKLTDAIVRSILADIANGATQEAVAARVGVSRSTVRRIASRETWRHIPDPRDLLYGKIATVSRAVRS